MSILQVGLVCLTGLLDVKFLVPVKKGDKVRFEGGGKSFSQQLGSIEKDHKKVARVTKRQEVGVKVAKQVREGYRVFK